jgi:hypothetical protein
MTSALARELNRGVRRGEEPQVAAKRKDSSHMWMSWREIADRLEVRIKELEELLPATPVEAEDSVFGIWHANPESDGTLKAMKTANLATIALDLVALRHMQALAHNYAIAFRKEQTDDVR